MTKPSLDLKKDFKNKNLFEQAFTHRSWVNEHAGEESSNERLEFLGDAILEFVVSSDLFEKFPDKEEGFLTNLRANLVNTKNLSQVATKLNIGENLKLSKGEAAGGGNANPSLLADTLEAIIGAIFIDRGFTHAESFIHDNILSDLENKLEEPLKDPKSRLQELVQAKGYSTPKYQVVKEEGPDHNKLFEVEVIVNNQQASVGQGKSKNQAEQAAAVTALARFEAK